MLSGLAIHHFGKMSGNPPTTFSESHFLRPSSRWRMGVLVPSVFTIPSVFVNLFSNTGKNFLFGCFVFVCVCFVVVFCLVGLFLRQFFLCLTQFLDFLPCL